MGGCVGRERSESGGSSRRRRGQRRRGVISCCYLDQQSHSNSKFRCLVHAHTHTHTHTAHNEPLKKDKPRWKSDYPMTEGQLRSKRDEFWDTAPAFEGRKEIWDALKAAAVALECNDHELAQAILDGASITLPHGSLTECYDELGNRYQLPVYCLAPPVNLITERSEEDVVPENPDAQPAPRKEFQLKVRLSTGKDVRLNASMTDPVGLLKKQLQAQEGIEVTRQRWFFSGKLLTDKTRLQDTKIQKDFVVQVIVNQAEC
ncbi:Ubiquitin domain-containing protein 1 [Bagarius yarrelli]|uniref:Ubiquitin domain-containing protein 1 n=1 Tax=Bagarius yarrelli TaxID=175774 RepID=A0A556U127_BAGYA|nr:Ubiquitin domain-containing protein 1 [Bagarius yarrelli]